MDIGSIQDILLRIKTENPSIIEVRPWGGRRAGDGGRWRAGAQEQQGRRPGPGGGGGAQQPALCLRLPLPQKPFPHFFPTPVSFPRRCPPLPLSLSLTP